MAFKKVKAKWRDLAFEGILIEEGEFVVIKLNNGYNITLPSKEVSIVELGTLEKKEVRKEEKEEGEYTLILTGGTIASKVEYETGAVKPVESVEELAYGEMISNFKVVKLFSLFSEELTPKHWIRLADAVREEVENGSKGVLILHGTDTMHYTSHYLSFSLKGIKVPVILTGAQRSADRPSTDANENILSSIFALKKAKPGVYVVMHSSVNDDGAFAHLGTKVRKMHTSRRDAFQSINSLPYAYLNHREGIWEEYISPPKMEWEFKNGFEDKTALLYYFPGMRPEILDYYSSFKGIVLVGTGLGHIPVRKEEGIFSFASKIKELIEKGVYVAVSSQTIHGRINLNVYTTGRLLEKMGVLGHNTDFHPELAYVKLGWLLANFPERVRELYHSNLVGELNYRIPLEAFCGNQRI